MLTYVIAAVDGAVGLYLVRYAYPRQHHDRDRVLAVGLVLLCCAAILVVLELTLTDGRLPAIPGVPVRSTEV